MKIISIFLLLSLFYSSLSVKNAEKKALLSKLASLLEDKRETPQDYERYIANSNSNTTSYSGIISNQNHIDTLKKKLPFINSQNLKYLSILLNNKRIGSVGSVAILTQTNILNKSTITEILGAAILTDDKNIFYLIFVANSTGTVLRQIEQRTRRECKKKWFKKYCWDEVYDVERQNNAQEIEGMKKILLSKSILSMKSKYYEEREKIQTEIDFNNQNIDINSDMYKIQSKKNIFLKNIETLIDNSRQKPNNYETIVRNIKSYTDVNMDMFEKNELELICKKYNLPNDVKNNLHSLAFSSKPNMEKKIKYFNAVSKVSTDELIGFAMKENNTIFFAYIRSITEGEMVNKYTSVEVNKCRRIIFWKVCHKEKRTVHYSYSENEYFIAKNALMYMSGQSLDRKLNTMKESQTLLGKDGKIISKNKKYCAIIGKNGIIYIGLNPNPDKNILYTIGEKQNEAYAPYSLQIKENGNIFIINKNNNKVWSMDTFNNGIAPFSLVLNDDGSLNLVDSKGNILYGKKN